MPWSAAKKTPILPESHLFLAAPNGMWFPVQHPLHQKHEFLSEDHQGSPQFSFLIPVQVSPSNRPHNLLTYFMLCPSNLPGKYHKSRIWWALFPVVDAVYAESPSSLGHSSQMHWDPRTSFSKIPWGSACASQRQQADGQKSQGS